MKKAIRCIAFLIILGMLLLTVYEVLRWKDTSGDYLSATTQLYATEENLIDLVFLGSSHGYCGIVPDELWGTYGYSGFNLSTSGQDKNATYYLLKELLKTQSPKVVCIDLFGLAYDGYGVEGNQHRNMLALKLSKNSIELIKETLEDEDAQTGYILKWPIIHTRYKELTKYDFIPFDYSVYGRSIPINFQAGYAWYTESTINSTEVGELTDTNRKWVEDLYQLSLEEDFELIFMMVPSEITLEDQKQINAVGEFAKERNLGFIDFNKMRAELGINNQTDFIDATHLNALGAKKVTKYLGEYIDLNIGLEDHRGEEAYNQWEQSYAYYEEKHRINTLETAPTFDDFAVRLDSMNNVTYIVSLCGEYKESTLDMKQMVMALGLPEEAYEQGGTYISIDGQMQLALEADSEDIYIYDLNEWNSFKLWNAQLHDAELTNLDNIMLNLVPQGVCYSGLNIIVYDNVTHEIIAQKGYF